MRGSQPVLLSAPSYRPRSLLAIPVVANSMVLGPACVLISVSGFSVYPFPQGCEKVHGIKKMEILGFPGCVSTVVTWLLAGAPPSGGALQRWKIPCRGQQQIWFWFFLLYEWRMFWGSCCTTSVPDAPSALSPGVKCREEALLSRSWPGEEDG